MTVGGTPSWQGSGAYPAGPAGPGSAGRSADGRGVGGTGERLRAALSARSAQVSSAGPGTGSAGPGWQQGGYPGAPGGYPPPGPSGYEPGGWDRTGYTRQQGGRNSGRGGRGGPSGRPPLLPRWAKAALAVGLVLSALLGVVLALQTSDTDDQAQALPPARETSYGEDRARVAIASFYRQDRFATLELELTNLAPLGSDDNWSVNNAFGSSSSYDLSGIRLLDPVSGASYRTAEDGAGDCLCTNTISLTVVPGSSTRVSAQFAAPPPTVKMLNIDIPGAGTFRDVRLG